MQDEEWQLARLIPVTGIGGKEEQERRATSALLAVLSAVKEYGRAITKRIGAPAGNVTTFVEPAFEVDGRRLVPDGLIRVQRGKTEWTALVEVKTSTARLEREQVEGYLDIAREQGFDALLTISNEIPAVPGRAPTRVDKRKIRTIELHHLSWTFLLTEAVVQKVHRGVEDPDQAWILGELIRYLEHPRSGALEFEDLGASWVTVRDAVKAGTLRVQDKGGAEVARGWDRLLRYAALHLGAELGVEVHTVLTRGERADRTTRLKKLVDSMVELGRLEGGLRIADTVGQISVAADLRAKQVSATVDVGSPQEGRPRTRINWLIRQLKGAPDALRIDAFAAHSRSSMSELLGDVRENPDLLIADGQPDLKKFRLTLTASMGRKRGNGQDSFVESILSVIDEFYQSTVQDLRSWTPRAPRLKKQENSKHLDAPDQEKATTSEKQAVINIDADEDNADWLKRVAEMKEGRR